MMIIMALPSPILIAGLEDDTSAQTMAWVEAQNQLTQQYLAALPDRPAQLCKTLERLFRYERYSVPEPVGSFIYFTHNDGTQNQSPLYREPAGGGERQLVLDPNSLSVDNTTSLAGTSFSRDGWRLAYQTSTGGSDWHEVSVLDLTTLRQMPDKLADVKFSGLSWWRDGFFYSRYPQGRGQAGLSQRNLNHTVYYHELGNLQARDRAVFSQPTAPERNVGAVVSDEERYLILSASQGTSGNSLSIARLSGSSIGKVQPVVTSFDKDYNFVYGQGDSLYFWTNAEAPNGRLVVLDAAKPQRGFVDVLPEDKLRPLKEVTISGRHIYARYLQDVSSKLEVYDLAAQQQHDMLLPGLGKVTGVNAKATGGLVLLRLFVFNYAG